MGTNIERSLASIIRHELKTSGDATDRTANATTRAIDYLTGKSISGDAVERVIRGAVQRAGVEFSAGEAIITGVLGTSAAVAATQAGAKASVATLPSAPRVSLDAIYVAHYVFNTMLARADAIVASATEAKDALPLLPPLPPAAAEPAPAAPAPRTGGVRQMLKSFAAGMGYTDAPPAPAPTAPAIPPAPRASISGSDFILAKTELFDTATPLGKATIAPFAEAVLRSVQKIADVGPGGQVAIDAMKAEVAQLPPTIRVTGKAMAEILTNKAIGPTFMDLPLGARDAVARGLFEVVLNGFAFGKVDHSHAILLNHFLDAMSFEARRDHAIFLAAELFHANTDVTCRPMNEQSRELLLRAIANGALRRPLPGDDATLLRMLGAPQLSKAKLNQLLDFTAKCQVLSVEATEKILAAIPRGVSWACQSDNDLKTMNGRLVAYGHGPMWDLGNVHADVKIASDVLAKTAMTDDAEALTRIYDTVRDIFRTSDESKNKQSAYLIQLETMLLGQVERLSA